MGGVAGAGSKVRRLGRHFAEGLRLPAGYHLPHQLGLIVVHQSNTVLSVSQTAARSHRGHARLLVPQAAKPLSLTQVFSSFFLYQGTEVENPYVLQLANNCVSVYFFVPEHFKSLLVGGDKEVGEVVEEDDDD